MAEDGRSALLHALDAPHLEIARLLLANGAHTSGQYRWSTLAMLAMQRDLKDGPDLEQGGRLKFLLQAGVAIDEQDYRGRTPLMQLAEQERNLKGFTWLLQHPQNLDLRTAKDQETALYRAFWGNNYPAMKLLINAGANLNLSYGGGTCYNQPMGQSLLTLLADKISADDTSRVVSQQDTLEVFTLLLEKGADPNVGQRCEKKGYALLLEAIARKNARTCSRSCNASCRQHRQAEATGAPQWGAMPFQGRIAVTQSGHIDPLLAVPAVLQNPAPRKTVIHRISLRRTRKC